MKIALSTILGASMLFASAAPAQDNPIDDRPEAVVRAVYSLLSFDPSRPMDRERLGDYFTDEAIVGFGRSFDEVAVMPLDAFFDEAERRVRAGKVGGVGHTLRLEDVECSVVGEVAMCFVTYRLRVPGDDVEDYIGKRGITLRRHDGRWLITDVIWVVTPPEGAEVEPSVDVGLSWLPTAGGGIRPTPGRTWNRALPILGQKVVEKGFNLPMPYGVALVGAWKRQDIDLYDLSIRVPGGEWTTIPFPLFNEPYADTSTVQAKFDFWLLPFLNVYALAGRVEGDSIIPLSFLGADLMDLIGTGDLCDSLRPPASCFRTYSGTYRGDISGDNLSIGINPALGYKDFFFTMPTTWTWTDVDSSDRVVESFYLSPRIGLNVPTRQSGGLSVYIGAAYLRAENFITGSIDVDTSDMPGAEDGLTIEYSVWSDNSDRWNFLVGFNWSITQRWNVHFEADAGGSRQGGTFSATWRF